MVLKMSDFINDIVDDSLDEDFLDFSEEEAQPEEYEHFMSLIHI